MHAPCRLSVLSAKHARAPPVNKPTWGVALRVEPERPNPRRAGTPRSVTRVSTAEPPRDRYFTLRGNALKRWVRIHLWVYRRTRGRLLYKMRGMPTLLLTTTGRRTGRHHTVPLPYFDDTHGKVVIGSFAGGDHDPAWVLNITANPAVQ